MTDRHFIVFNAVFESRNMTAAAGQLFISQPSVSRYIADLERHYRDECLIVAAIALEL